MVWLGLAFHFRQTQRQTEKQTQRKASSVSGDPPYKAADLGGFPGAVMVGDSPVPPRNHVSWGLGDDDRLRFDEAIHNIHVHIYIYANPPPRPRRSTSFSQFFASQCHAYICIDVSEEFYC